MGRDLTRGERNIFWIETYCRIPEGKDVGKPVVLRDWQKHEICKIYDNPHGTRLAILSFGKKNAKTTIAAFLLLLHLCGPEAVPNSQLPSTAQSREQAAVLFNLAAKIVRLSRDLDEVVTIRDTLKELHCLELGTRYRALSAEDATAHGQSPIFAIHDELGQVRGPVSKLYNAIENAMGAHEAPMSIIISTQAPTDADLLSVLIDNALDDADPTTVLSLYTADPLLDPFSDEALRQANPAAGDFLSIKELRRQAENARRMPSQEALYRNYTLNQRVDVSSPFVSRATWKACGGAVVPDFAGLPVFAGLDLSRRVRPDGVCGDGAGRRGVARAADGSGFRATGCARRRPPTGWPMTSGTRRASWRRHRARPSITGLSPRCSATSARPTTCGASPSTAGAGGT